MSKLAREVPESLLNHYTSENGFAGIVGSKSFHATDIEFLNDSSEFRQVFDIAYHLMSGVLLDEYPEFKAQISTYLSHIVRGYERSVYVVSFSEAENDLSQWRAYSTHGRGYQLSFSPDRIREFAVNRGWRLEKVTYDWDQCRLDTQRALLDIFEKMRNGTLTLDWEDQSFWTYVARTLYTIAPTYKNEAFQGEKEWRLIIGSDTVETINTKIGRRGITPFATLDWSGSSDILARVLLGPGHDRVSAKGVRILLGNAGLYPHVESSDIPFLG